MRRVTRRQVLLSGALLVLSVGFVSRAESQAGSGVDDVQVRHRSNCRLAHQVLVHGRPAIEGEWALGYANGCGALGGEALAGAIPAYRGVSTPGGEMEKLVESVALLTDRRVFEAALALASDRSGGTAARVNAIRIMYHQLNPATFQRYEAFVTDSWETKIVYMPYVVSEAPPMGTPLPSDALQQAERALDAIEADAVAPRAIRLAAAYLRGNVELQSAKARLCGAGVTSQECSRRLDEWEAQQDTPL